MSLSLKPIHEQTIVITGASSGIGLATAIAAAARGARVVLVARNTEALAEIEQKLIGRGADALYITGDVANRDDIHHIIEATVQRFGGFDTWVNNAGVEIWGRLDEVSDEDSRRLFEVNFWGTVHGSLAALAQLRGRGGAIINVGSIESEVPMPLQGMYAASKHAVKAFTDVLRVETNQANVPVAVTLIKPAGIDTPLSSHAQKYTDVQPVIPPPLYPPEEVAMAILHAAEHPTADIIVGGVGKLFTAINHRAPSVMSWINQHVLYPLQLSSDEPPRHDSSLHHPGQDGMVHGNNPGPVLSRSLYTRAVLHPMLTGTLVAGACIAMLAMVRDNPLTLLRGLRA